MKHTAYIELKDITKSFGSVTANNHINFMVNKGEIHALLGENGSGKSTLMNIMCGIYTPEQGNLYINGEEKRFRSPKEAISAGIGMIHQHFKLVEVLSAMENIIAGFHKGTLIQDKKLKEEIRTYADKYGLKIEPDKKVYTMSVSEKQNVEIIKALYRGAKILILDEPTAVLTPQETKILFQILRRMKEQGCSIIIITHKLNEVMEISDRVTILRKGESIATLQTAEIDELTLSRHMVGKTLSLNLVQEPVSQNAEPILSVKQLSISPPHKPALLKDITLELKKGEIHGIAGIAGSGQDVLCEAVMGLRSVSSGQILYDNKDITGLPFLKRNKANIKMGFVPEDRLGMGLVSGLSITDNILLRFYQNWKGAFMNRKQGEKKAQEIVEKYNVNPSDIHQIIDYLSGGNMQKVLLGRELDLQSKVLITAYPVRGLDIGAAYSIYKLLKEEKKKGAGILFIGEDLDVLLSLCDRITVMYEGRITGTVNANEVTKEEIGLLMLGKNKEVKNIV